MGVFMGEKGKKVWYVALYAGALYGVLRYFFGLAAPFLAAFLLVYFCEPYLKKLQKRTHIRREILLGGMLALLLFLLAAAVWGLLSWSSVHAAQIGEGIDSVRGRVGDALHGCCLFLEKNWGLDAAKVERAMLDSMEGMSADLRESMLPEMTKRSWACCKRIAGAAAFIGVSLISSLLLCRDYENILEKLDKNPVFDVAWNFMEKIAGVLGGYIRAQGVLMLVITLIAAAGLLLGRVGNALLLAVLTGLLDALPFVGSGIVLVPTSLWQLMTGNFRGACAAVIAYALCIAARELLEPKLLGKQVGIYPVAMFFAVYAGVKLFGFSGIFLGPLYLVLFKEGAAALWNGSFS